MWKREAEPSEQERWPMEKGLQIKGAVSQGIQETSRSWKRQENELSSLQEGRQLC